MNGKPALAGIEVVGGGGQVDGMNGVQWDPECQPGLSGLVPHRWVIYTDGLYLCLIGALFSDADYAGIQRDSVAITNTFSCAVAWEGGVFVPPSWFYFGLKFKR